MNEKRNFVLSLRLVLFLAQGAQRRSISPLPAVATFPFCTLFQAVVVMVMVRVDSLFGSVCVYEKMNLFLA